MVHSSSEPVANSDNIMEAYGSSRASLAIRLDFCVKHVWGASTALLRASPPRVAGVRPLIGTTRKCAIDLDRQCRKYVEAKFRGPQQDCSH